jgi:hypothetical protein
MKRRVTDAGHPKYFSAHTKRSPKGSSPPQRERTMPDPVYEAKYGKGPHLAVDAIIVNTEGEIAIIRRKDNSRLALPGAGGCAGGARRENATE